MFAKATKIPPTTRSDIYRQIHRQETESRTYTQAKYHQPHDQTFTDRHTDKRQKVVLTLRQWFSAVDRLHLRQCVFHGFYLGGNLTKVHCPVSTRGLAPTATYTTL